MHEEEGCARRALWEPLLCEEAGLGGALEVLNLCRGHLRW